MGRRQFKARGVEQIADSLAFGRGFPFPFWYVTITYIVSTLNENRIIPASE
jgi:hypothetical protein